MDSRGVSSGQVRLLFVAETMDIEFAGGWFDLLPEGIFADVLGEGLFGVVVVFVERGR